MTCRELTELINDYLEGQLPLRTRVRLQLHLGLCGDCRAYLRQLKSVIGALGRLPELDPPEPVRSELLERLQIFAAERRKRGPGS